MSAPRNRYQSTTTHKGRLTYTSGYVHGGHTVIQSTSSCSDITGRGDCAPFTVNKTNMNGGRVNTWSNSGSDWYDYRVDYMDNPSHFSHLSSRVGEDFPDTHYATLAVARTNPSRPSVDIPVALLELGDIVKTIRRLGRGLFDTSVRSTGQAYLRYQFGIRPLIGDLVKIANFQDALDGRLRELSRLAGPSGLRRTLSLGGWSNNYTENRWMQSVGYAWWLPVTQTTIQAIRAHVRWRPGGNFMSLEAGQRQRLAYRSVLGLTVDASTLWEVLPWSWLVDYGTNVGNWFQANRNIVPATLDGVHIMRETRTEYRTPEQHFPQGYQSPVNVSVHTKTRNPSFAAPTAHFPVLNAGQMGILGSLAATRLG